MYIPAAFREDRIDVLHEAMREYSFATLVSTGQDGLIATHLPLLLDASRGTYGTLIGHVARENPHWRAFEGSQETLAMFQGPHAYITPSWYEAELAVPTWDYATVHAYGVPRIIEDHDELLAHLRSLIATHEAQFARPWPGALPEDYLDTMMKGIVGFSIRLTRLEGKFKMSQNRSTTDRERVSAELMATDDPMRREVGELVQGTRHRD